MCGYKITNKNYNEEYQYQYNEGYVQRPIQNFFSNLQINERSTFSNINIIFYNYYRFIKKTYRYIGLELFFFIGQFKRRKNGIQSIFLKLGGLLNMPTTHLFLDKFI